MASPPETGYRNLRVEGAGETARIVLNRPEKRNALSLELLEEMTAALRELAGDTAVRVVVIEGAGPAFSAGHDLSEMVGREGAFFHELFDRCTVVMQAVQEIPQTVVAKV